MDGNKCYVNWIPTCKRVEAIWNLLSKGHMCMNKIICTGFCESPHLYILLHNMVLMLIFMTNISIATNNEQKCIQFE